MSTIFMEGMIFLLIVLVVGVWFLAKLWLGLDEINREAEAREEARKYRY